MARFVLWGTYCDDVLEKRVPFREQHLNRLSRLKNEGILITLGPTTCSTHVFGIFEASSIDIVRNLLKEDIYWEQSIWTQLEVYPWTQSF